MDGSRRRGRQSRFVFRVSSFECSRRPTRTPRSRETRNSAPETGTRLAEGDGARAAVFFDVDFIFGASQPRACMTVSRGASTSLTSLARVWGPLCDKTCHTAPAVWPISATHDSLVIVAIKEPLTPLKITPSCPRGPNQTGDSAICRDHSGGGYVFLARRESAGSEKLATQST